MLHEIEASEGKKM